MKTELQCANSDLILFQSHMRETDVMLMRTQYNKGKYPDREFMRPIGDISFHFLARAPKPIQNYLTIIKPCDNYVWSLLAFSVVVISLTIVMVDISYEKWTETSSTGVFHQSKLHSFILGNQGSV